MSNVAFDVPETAAARITRWGKDAAQRVWDRTLRHGYGPDDLAELVSDEVEVLAILIDAEGIQDPDRTTILNFFEAAVIAEGKQLAILFAMDAGGTA